MREREGGASAPRPRGGRDAKRAAAPAARRPEKPLVGSFLIGVAIMVVSTGIPLGYLTGATTRAMGDAQFHAAVLGHLPGTELPAATAPAQQYGGSSSASASGISSTTAALQLRPTVPRQPVPSMSASGSGSTSSGGDAAHSGSSGWCIDYDLLVLLLLHAHSLAAALGTLLSGAVLDALGRRAVLLLACCVYSGGAMLKAAASGVAVFASGIVLSGCAAGALMHASLVYLADIAPPSRRGALMTSYQLAMVVGVFSCTAGYYVSEAAERRYSATWGWRLMYGLGAGLALALALVAACLLPDTPPALLLRGRARRAAAVLAVLRGRRPDDPEVAEELRVLAAAASAARSGSCYRSGGGGSSIGAGGAGGSSSRAFGVHCIMSGAAWRAPFTAPHAPALLLSCALMLLQQLTGDGMVSHFSVPLLLDRATVVAGGAGAAANAAAALVGAVVVAGLLLLVLRVDAWGRRLWLVEGSLQVALALIASAAVSAVYMHGGGGDDGMLPRGAAVGLLVMSCLLLTGYCWGLGGCGMLVAVELHSLATRSRATAIAIAVGFLAQAAAGVAELPLLCAMRFGLLLLYACFALLAAALCALLLPETSGVPLEGMTARIGEHRAWRRWMAPHLLPLPPSTNGGVSSGAGGDSGTWSSGGLNSGDLSGSTSSAGGRGAGGSRSSSAGDAITHALPLPLLGEGKGAAGAPPGMQLAPMPSALLPLQDQHRGIAGILSTMRRWWRSGSAATSSSPHGHGGGGWRGGGVARCGSSGSTAYDRSGSAVILELHETLAGEEAAAADALPRASGGWKGRRSRGDKPLPPPLPAARGGGGDGSAKDPRGDGAGGSSSDKQHGGDV